MAVDLIDFSCKHDILIKWGDSYLPMDEPYFESEKVAEDTWKVLSSGDFCYIIKGDGEAFALDCGYGAGNIRKYMESVCGVPVPAVINSHDHFDHTACNAYFDRAYMSPLCVKYATVPFPSFEGIDFHPDSYERIAVKEGEMVPLKGRELEAIQICDHTKTSMMYLDRKCRILFTGDEFFGMPMKPLSGGLTSWVNNLQKIKAVWDDFDIMCGGNGVRDKEYIQGFIDCAEYALAHPEEAESGQPGGPGGPGGKKGGGPQAMPDHDGHKVYDRMAPHFGDRTEYDPEDQAKARLENMVMLKHNGFMIRFDRTLIGE